MYKSLNIQGITLILSALLGPYPCISFIDSRFLKDFLDFRTAQISQLTGIGEFDRRNGCLDCRTLLEEKIDQDMDRCSCVKLTTIIKNDYINVYNMTF